MESLDIKTILTVFISLITVASIIVKNSIDFFEDFSEKAIGGLVVIVFLAGAGLNFYSIYIDKARKYDLIVNYVPFAMILTMAFVNKVRSIIISGNTRYERKFWFQIYCTFISIVISGLVGYYTTFLLEEKDYISVTILIIATILVCGYLFSAGYVFGLKKLRFVLKDKTEFIGYKINLTKGFYTIKKDENDYKVIQLNKNDVIIIELTKEFNSPILKEDNIKSNFKN